MELLQCTFSYSSRISFPFNYIYISYQRIIYNEMIFLSKWSVVNTHPKFFLSTTFLPVSLFFVVSRPFQTPNFKPSDNNFCLFPYLGCSSHELRIITFILGCSLYTHFDSSSIRVTVRPSPLLEHISSPFIFAINVEAI